jgi:predicted Ser/Thr protein kinase
VSELAVQSVEHAARHGRVVAREAVQAGLVRPDQIRSLFQEYGVFVQAGVLGTFTQLLHARAVIDDDGARLLEQRAPLAGTPATPPPDTRSAEGSRSDSKVASGTRSSLQRSSGLISVEQPGSAKAEAGPKIQKASSSTHPYEGVLDPAVETSKARSSTIGYRQVLEHGGSSARHKALSESDPGMTLDYDAVLPAPSQGEVATRATEGPNEQDAGSGQFPPEFRRSASEVILAPDMADYVASQEAAFFSLDEDSDEDSQLTMREPAVGDVLGDYTLLKVIGRGGMGVIYLARQAGTGETFALKTLTVGQGERGKQRRARFQREVEALRRLEHPNIVKVHTCGRKGPFDFYVMEYVDGRELKKVLKKEELPRRKLLDVFIDVCKAVHHANERSVIHRDLKPGNVLLDANDHVFVLDFGLAKLTDDQEGITRTGSALGTPYYMAPEQLTNPKGVDARSDVWSLGVMLYEMMTGQRPFQGETTGEITSKILRDEPLKPSMIVDGLDPAVDAVCLRALEKDLSRRYPDVDALRRDANRLRKGRGVRGASELSQAADALRRWFEKQKEGLLIGIFVASLIYVPLIWFVYRFL